MKIFLIIMGIIILLITAIIVYVIGKYNYLSVLRVKTEEAYSGMDVFLKKRFDMIPNLVNTVKGYAGHEKDVLENITKARASVGSAKTAEENLKAQSEMTSALSRLLVVSENYPELKANENFVQLSDQIKTVEEEISSSRLYYNGVVTKYNAAIIVFPTNIIASMFNMTRKPLFEIESRERENVKVEF